MNERYAGYAAMAVGAATWGSLPVVVRYADAPAPLLVCMRMGFGALALGVVVLPAMRGKAIPRGHVRPFFGLGVLLAVHWVLFFRSLQMLPGATPVIVNYVFPLLVAVAAPVVLREPRERHVLPLALLGFAGLVVILAPQAQAGRLDAVAVALASACGAAGLVVAGRHVAQLAPAPVVAFWQYTVGFVVLLPWALASGAPSGVPWKWGALIGVVHTAATGVLFFFSLSRVPAQEAGVLMYIEPASAVVFAWIFLHDAPGLLDVVGGLLVVGAGAGIVVGASRSTATTVAR